MDTTTKHTPGPWTVGGLTGREDGNGVDERNIEADGGAVICSVWPMGADFDQGEATGAPEREANARLIATAPELRAVLTRIAALDPIYDDADEGPFCTFCMKQQGHGRDTHTGDCEWIVARALLARIDGD